jgi:hypothetical protein
MYLDQEPSPRKKEKSQNTSFDEAARLPKQNYRGLPSPNPAVSGSDAPKVCGRVCAG